MANKIPTQPTLIKYPFCADGNKNTIPETNSGLDGLASYSLGFPPITEQPITNGGIPPVRKDFNGILNALSTFCFFAQSGGVYSYSTNINYTTPAVVFYNNILWYCVRENGTDSTNGVHAPGSSASYWVRLIDHILEQATKSVGTPIGTIIMWASNNNPSDGGVWLDCNGQSCTSYPALVSVLGSNNVPDMRGLFPRCVGSQNLNVTINGTTTSQSFNGGTVGTKRADAIRNITGTFFSESGGGSYPYSGAFGYEGSGYRGIDGGDNDNARSTFDASKVVPVANENRPASVSLRFLIKAE